LPDFGLEGVRMAGVVAHGLAGWVCKGRHQ
jgi:hypothetical protein